MLRVEFSHSRPMLFDKRLHMQRLGEQFVPVGNGKVNCVTFSGSSAVIVHGPSVHRTNQPMVTFSEPREEAPSPIGVSAVWTRTDEREGNAVTRHPSGKPAEFHRVFLGREIASTTPGLIAHTPEADPKRLDIARNGALV